MKNSLQDYWSGYNYCKHIVSERGYDEALAEYDYSLDGKSYTYSKGFARYLRFYADKHADDLVMYECENEVLGNG